jgi:prepilin-type N-terminal cleavage/methylation domain-containing protein/prepilin-type processing-associated H-X9-DG protein
MRLQRAFTLIELIAVIVILVVLAALLFPGFNRMADHSRLNSCKNNQRQILFAMLTYATDCDGVWPVRPSLADGSYDPSPVPRDGLSTTIGSFEFLAVQTGGELLPKVFMCPSEPKYRPTVQTVLPLDGSSATISHWCVQATAEPHAVPGYAYDWSVPKDALSSRVVLADRGRGTHAHGKQVVVAFGDGHVGVLRVQRRTATATLTRNIDGSVADPAEGFGNTDAKGDDIYDDAGDGPGMAGIATGSSTRAWVR